MSRICRNMEDSGKHLFHGLDHDSKMGPFKTYSNTSTLRGYEASGKKRKQKTTNEERKRGNGRQNTPANGGVDRRESYHFLQIREERGTEGNILGKTGTMQKTNKKKHVRKR